MIYPAVKSNHQLLNKKNMCGPQIQNFYSAKIKYCGPKAHSFEHLKGTKTKLFCDTKQNGALQILPFQNSPGSQHQMSSNCTSLQQPTGDGDDDLWRGHSIAALRRRASELNASSIPSYLHAAHSYEHHNSVY